MTDHSKWVRSAGVACVAACVLLWPLWPAPVGEPRSLQPAPARRAEIPATAASRAAPRERVHVVADVPVPAPAPSAAAPAVAARPEAEPATAEFTVRDVWNEAPVQDVELVLDGELTAAEVACLNAHSDASSGRWAVRSDSSGRIRLPLQASRTDIEAVAPGWTFVTCDETGPDGAPTIWIHATLEIRGRVAVADSVTRELDMRNVRIGTWGHGPDLYPSMTTSPARETLDGGWLEQHHLARFEDVARVDEGGRFQCEVPRVRGIVVHAIVAASHPATSAGWQPATAAVRNHESASRRVTVDLVFSPGYVVGGVLTDEFGQPVKNAMCRLHVTRPLTEEELKPSELLAHGHGYTVVGNSKTREYSVDFQIVVHTDASGRFEFISNVEGDATIYVEPASGHHVSFFHIGAVSQFGRLEPLIVESDVDHATVQVLSEAGQSLAGRSVRLLDLTNRLVQVAVRRTLDDRSALPARLLVRGHRYVVEERGSDGRPVGLSPPAVVWDGEREIRIPSRKAFATSR